MTKKRSEKEYEMMNLDVDTNKPFDEAVGADTEQAKQADQPNATIVVPNVEASVSPKPAQTSAVATTESKKVTVQADERGVLKATNFEEQWRMATALHQSGLMPRGLDSVAKVFAAVQLLSEQRLPVMSTIGKVMVLNGTAAIHSELPLALVRRSGLLEYIKETWVKDEKGVTIKAICTLKRKDSDPIAREFGVADAKVAQLWAKTSRDGKPSPWVLYPERMMQMRARSWALKDEFPDVLLGIPMLEYDHNAIVVNGNVITDVDSDQETVASKLNRTYLVDETPKAEAAQ